MTAPILTRRCFVFVAQTIATCPLEQERAAIAEHFASALAATNPRFDRERFLAACGVESRA
jgi:hypothetical protein